LSPAFGFSVISLLRWFERAAAQGHAEGLYNVGVFHANGQGGIPRNAELADEYFYRAANAAKPFPMALHAMGNRHREPGPKMVRYLHNH
jgi:TPR repeat protein